MEIEIKILNVSELRTKLLNLGAKQVFSGSLKDLFFENSEMKHKKQVLRLRNFISENSVIKSTLTWKGVIIKSKFKVRPEIEIIVDDFEKTHTLLMSVGFKQIFSDIKKRDSYTLFFNNSKFIIDFDKYSDIPEFAEIEAESEEQLSKIIESLNIQESDIFYGSKKELFKKYLKD